jgi:hypothetical protein
MKSMVLPCRDMTHEEIRKPDQSGLASTQWLQESQSKKRPAPPAGKGAPPAKQQKGQAGKPDQQKGGKEAPKTPAGKGQDAPKTPKPAATPGGGAPPATPASGKKEVPKDVKAKVKQLLAGQAGGVKGADFPREWQKAFSTPFKDAFMKLGFKKQGDFMAACADVVESK